MKRASKVAVAEESDGIELVSPQEPPSKKKRTKRISGARISICKESEREENLCSSLSMSDSSQGDASNCVKMPTGLILKGGRLRLPDKLIEYLNKEVAPEVLYWQTGGSSFSFDYKRAQVELLDKYFNGTKITSFTRSLNRWGFKRIFHALLPKHLLSYEHPLFLRDEPELVLQMKMSDGNEAKESAKTNDRPQDRDLDAVTPNHAASNTASIPDSASVPEEFSTTRAATSTSVNSGLQALSLVASQPQMARTLMQLNPSLLQGLLSQQQQYQHPNYSATTEQQQQQNAASQVALQALMANQQYLNFSRSLQLGEVDVSSLLRSIIGGHALLPAGTSHQQQQQQQWQQPQQQQPSPFLQFQVQLHPAFAASPGETSLQSTITQEQQRQAAQQLLLSLLLPQQNITNNARNEGESKRDG